jgi:hypothetical protein
LFNWILPEVAPCLAVEQAQFPRGFGNGVLVGVQTRDCV